MKECGRCKQSKPQADFSKQSKAHDGLQSWCRPCVRDRYLDNKQEHIKNVGVRATKVRKELQEYVWAEKSKPCTDCQLTYHPFVMDFDHVSGKKYKDVSALTRAAYSLEVVKKEIEKCELVCANCHRIRTGKRAGLIP